MERLQRQKTMARFIHHKKDDPMLIDLHRTLDDVFRSFILVPTIKIELTVNRHEAHSKAQESCLDVLFRSVKRGHKVPVVTSLTAYAPTGGHRCQEARALIQGTNLM